MRKESVTNTPRTKAATARQDVLKKGVKPIVAALKREFPEAPCALRHDGPFQLLIATILSAQCTDERVNLVTATLFARYPTAADLASLPLTKLEKEIQSTGFFRNKAKNIQACCQMLVERYDSVVPDSMERLVELPGVGRKTANVVLGTAFGIAVGVVVDTHVTRISGRLGLTSENTPEKIERDLMAILPQTEWIGFSHRIIHHGRKTCKAIRPRCENCSLFQLCPRVGVDPQ